MIKKYLVFISSTQDDLKTERRELTRIVQELGAIPVITDAFDLTEERDRKTVQKFIEECDFFLNLTAYKGGAAIGKSFALEFEYSCAAKAKIPVLAFIISEKARWKAAKKEKDEATIKALEAFKKKLESHPHEKWINLGDLRQKALFLISREMNLNPRRGWVPSTEAADPLVANELSRLIHENEILKNEIQMDGTDILKEIREKIKSTLKILASNRISLSFYYSNGENWENSRVFRYLRFFRLLTPELSGPKTVMDISHFMGNILNPDLKKVVRKDYPVPSNTIKKVMTDFALLKLVKCTRASNPNGSGDDEEWQMTEFGKEVFAVYRLRQMNRTVGLRSQKDGQGSSTKS